MSQATAPITMQQPHLHAPPHAPLYQFQLPTTHYQPPQQFSPNINVSAQAPFTLPQQTLQPLHLQLNQQINPFTTQQEPYTFLSPSTAAPSISLHKSLSQSATTSISHPHPQQQQPQHLQRAQQQLIGSTIDVTQVAKCREEVLSLINELKKASTPSGAEADTGEQPRGAVETGDTEDTLRLCKQIEYHLTKRVESSAVLQQLLPQLLELQQNDNNKSIAVRCLLVRVVEKACGIDGRRYLPILTPILQVLITDESSAVQKQVLIAVTAMLSLALATCCNTHSGNARDMAELYSTSSKLKTQSLKLVNSKNDGVRSYALRFVEQLVLTYSNTTPLRCDSPQKHAFTQNMIPTNHTLFTVKDIAAEAEEALEMMMKLPKSNTRLSIANLTVLVASLSNIARQRSTYMNQIISSLMKLHTHSGSMMQQLSEGHQKRFLHVLKNALFSFLRVEHIAPNLLESMNAAIHSMGFKDELQIYKKQLQYEKKQQALTPILNLQTSQFQLQQGQAEGQALAQLPAAAAQLPQFMAPASATPIPSAVLPTATNDLDNPQVRQVLHQLYALPKEHASELVLRSLNQFIPPPHIKPPIHPQGGMSRLLLHFLMSIHQAAQTAPPPPPPVQPSPTMQPTQLDAGQQLQLQQKAVMTPAPSASIAPPSTGVHQHIPSPTHLPSPTHPSPDDKHSESDHTAMSRAKHDFADRMEIIEQAVDHVSNNLTTPDTQLTEPISILASVPDIPVPSFTDQQCDQISRSAYSRVINDSMQTAAERAGRQTLRLSVLVKLATSRLLPVEHTVVIDESVQPMKHESGSGLGSEDGTPMFNPVADAVAAVTSSLTALPYHTSLLSYVLQDFPSRTELSIRWLYALLQIKPNKVIFVSKKGVEAEEQQQEEAELEWLKEHGQYVDQDEDDLDADVDVDVAADAMGVEVKGDDEKIDADLDAENTGNALTSTLKRKRDVDVDGTRNDDQSSKRSKSDSIKTASTSIVGSAIDAAIDKGSEQSKTIVVDDATAVCRWSWLSNAYGTPEYNDTLSNILTGIETSLLSQADLATSTSTLAPPQHLLFTRFILDLPKITDVVYTCINRCIEEPRRVNVALQSLTSLLLLRPPSRAEALPFLLNITYENDNKNTRHAAVTATTDKLFQQAPVLQSEILSYATDTLNAVIDPVTLSDLPQIHVEIVIPPPVEEQMEQLEREGKAREKAEGKTPLLTKAKPLTMDEMRQMSEEERIAERERRDQEAATQRQQEVLMLMRDADRRKKEFDRLTLKRQLAIKEKELMERTREERQRQREDRISRHVELYISLISKQPSLISNLLKVYAQSEDDIRNVILKLLPDTMNKLQRQEELINVLKQVAESIAHSAGVNLETAEKESSVSASASAPIEESQQVNDNEYAGSEQLISQVVQWLTKSSKPSAALVDISIALYDARNHDARMLLPVISSLAADQFRRFARSFVQLPAETVKEVVRKVYSKAPVAAATTPSIAPTMSSIDFLVTIHSVIDQNELQRRKLEEATMHSADGDTRSEEQKSGEAQISRDLMKQVIAAVNTCLNEKDIYNEDVMQHVLARLLDQQPLPKLLLRTMIQTYVAYPHLKPFLVTVLSRLISKKVWMDDTLFAGWCKLFTMTTPNSIQIIFVLPDKIFQRLLNDEKLVNETIKQQIVAYTKANVKSVSINKARMVLGEEEANQLYNPVVTPAMQFPVGMQPQMFPQFQPPGGQMGMHPAMFNNPQFMQQMMAMQQYQQQQQHQQRRF